MITIILSSANLINVTSYTPYEGPIFNKSEVGDLTGSCREAKPNSLILINNKENRTVFSD